MPVWFNAHGRGPTLLTWLGGLLLAVGTVCPLEGAAAPSGKARPDHWAYQKIHRPEIPLRSPGAGTGLNPIDAFVVRRLAAEGLQPSPAADRRVLIRRLYYDLLGLPPEPEAVARFTADPDPLAYENLVDRLLESPRFGERYARHWLDIAHYADTHGFERDKRRDQAWPYRDYVIEAFNADKPYERFLLEQIAGDVLWPEDPDAVRATGFLAAGPWDFVGQVETKSPMLRRAARALDLDDMVTQVMTATTATTVNCARCHDHKLDPISQREYYRLWAVFAGVKRDERDVSPGAVRQHAMEKARLEKERDRLAYALASIESRGLDLADLVGGGNGLGTGTKGHGLDPRNAVVQTRSFGFLGNVRPNVYRTALHHRLIDGVVIPNGRDGAAVPLSSSGISVQGLLPETSEKAWDAIRNGPVASQHSTVLDGTDYGQGEHRLLGLHANAGITFDLAAVRKAAGNTGLALIGGVGYFGKAGATQADAWVLLDGMPVVQHRGIGREDGWFPIRLPIDVSSKFLTLMATDGGDGLSHDQVCFTDLRLVADPPAELTRTQEGERRRLRAELDQAASRLAALGPPPKVFAVVAEQPPEIRVLLRGNPEAPMEDAVAPGALSVLGGLEADLGGPGMPEGGRRAALARWIVDPDNPLTWRVIVNRLWHWHFGQGLVNTPSDFGRGGGRPSHPELLDWLASELQRQGGSLKAMHRLICTSAAYRQQSMADDDARGNQIDVNNRLLWRQNAHRLEAEALRDAVLTASGRLNLEMGGPGYRDFKYTEAYAPIYDYVTADRPELWRRSIYRFVVRSTPQRFMTTLDCPDPANPTPVRLNTTTALQSLALFNNEFMLDQADGFAKRLEAEAGPDRVTQVRRGFQIAFGREPAEGELKLAVGFVQREGLPAFCRSLFNANEFVYVD